MSPKSRLGQNLQANPGLVATDPMLAWGTDVWCWMTSTNAVGKSVQKYLNDCSMLGVSPGSNTTC